MQEMPTIAGRVLRTHAPMPMAEPQVHDRRLVAALPQGRRHVLEPQRFHPEEWSEAETLVAGIGTQQQNAHRAARL